MKTIEEIKDLMVNKGVITNLAGLIRTNDEGFTECEMKYLAAVENLRSELPTEFALTLDEYLAACESDVISVVAYDGYLGFRVNLENFHNPIGIDFLKLYTIDYLIISNTTCSAISRSTITMPKLVRPSAKASL